jgi:hypothetical protein
MSPNFSIQIPEKEYAKSENIGKLLITLIEE